MAYAGSNRADVIDLLLPVVGNTANSVPVAGLATLAVGIIGTLARPRRRAVAARR